MSKAILLDIKIDDVNLNQAKNTVLGWLKNSSKKHFIATPNPEMLVIAQTDTEFKKVLNSADLTIPDGTGLKISGKIKNTVTGIDLMLELIKESEEYGFTVGLIGGSKNLAQTVADRLKTKFPGLKIIIADSNFIINKQGDEVNTPRLDLYNKSKDRLIYHDDLYKNIDILFVAFGQVKQEKWIYKNMHNINAKVLMGIGGSFDYIAGIVPRAPKFIRKLGFEWLFRLIIQPWRLKRQLSLFKFLWLILIEKFDKNLFAET